MQSHAFCCIMLSTHIDIQCLQESILLAILKKSYIFKSERTGDLKVKSVYLYTTCILFAFKKNVLATTYMII